MVCSWQIEVEWIGLKVKILMLNLMFIVVCVWFFLGEECDGFVDIYVEVVCLLLEIFGQVSVFSKCIRLVDCGNLVWLIILFLIQVEQNIWFVVLLVWFNFVKQFCIQVIWFVLIFVSVVVIFELDCV